MTCSNSIKFLDWNCEKKCEAQCPKLPLFHLYTCFVDTSTFDLAILQTSGLCRSVKCLGGPNPKPNCIRRSSRSPSNFWSLGMASSHIAGGAKHSIFQFKFKICSFPFSPFTMPYFLGPYLHLESFHQIYCFISCIAEKVCHVKLSTRLILGLPTRVCTNWSGQVGFGPRISLEPICSNFINSSNYWLAQNSSTHHSENLFRICSNISKYSTLGYPIEFSMKYSYSGMFWWACCFRASTTVKLWQNESTQTSQISLRFSTLETHWQPSSRRDSALFMFSWMSQYSTVP